MNSNKFWQILKILVFHPIRYIRAKLLLQWILLFKSQPLVFSQKPVLVFSPHQDDETFGCGGMIALKREHKIPVTVVFITDGQGVDNLDAHTKYKIVEVRKQEALTALGILGVEPSAIYFLEKPDGKLQDLNSRERQQTIQQVIELLHSCQPEEVYIPHRKDCHRDHEATYTLVKEAIIQAEITIKLFQYSVWMFWKAALFTKLKLHDIASANHLAITSVKNKKSRAISSYTTQIEGLPRGLIKLFLQPYELFFYEEHNSK